MAFRDLCKTSPFAQFLRQTQILILEILDVCLRLKSSSSLNLNKIEHFSKVSGNIFRNNILSFGVLLAFMLNFGCAQKTDDIKPTPWTINDGDLVTSGKYRAVTVSDLDNDGYLDIVGGGAFPGTVAIWYGDGSGSMTVPQSLPFKGDVRSITVADFDEDGDMDIALSIQRETSGIMVWLNKSERRWIRSVSPIEINNYEGIETADVNKDGHMDIIAANATSDTKGGIQVWLGDGSGAWDLESGPTVTGIFMDVALADFDQNGTLDIAGAGWGRFGALKVWFGDGAGGWSATAPLSKGSFYALSIGDINADGNMDILAGSYRQGVLVFLGDGKGNFTGNQFVYGKPESDRGDSFWQVLNVDLDGDGLMDVLAGSLDSRGVRAWRNEGPDAWAPVKGRFPSTGNFYEMTVTDLNADGRDDIVAASFGEGIKVWLGEGKYSDVSKERKDRKIAVPEVASVLAVPEENSVFTSASGVPEYKIGSGDALEITLWKGSTATRELITVKQTGKISFNMADDLYVNGFTASQVDDIITSKLVRYIRSPRVDVIVKEYKNKFVTLLGPGTAWTGGASGGKHYLTGRTTIVAVLSGTARLHQNANLAEVSLRRKSGQILKLNLFNAILRGEIGQDVILDDGDVIYIPLITKEDNRVYIIGEVAKPGVYAFTGSEMRLLDVVSQAGGVSVFAHEESTKIVRGDPTSPEIISIKLKSLLEKGDQTQNIALANGDLVYVPRSFIGDVNRFAKQVAPLLQLIVAPARIINEYDDAYRVLTE